MSIEKPDFENSPEQVEKSVVTLENLRNLAYLYAERANSEDMQNIYLMIDNALVNGKSMDQLLQEANQLLQIEKDPVGVKNGNNLLNFIESNRYRLPGDFLREEERIRQIIDQAKSDK